MSVCDGIIAVPGLPIGSAVIIDGVVKILQREDFVGISSVPRDVLHLVVLRGSGKGSSCNEDESEVSKQPSMQASGLVILKESDGTCDGWTVAHKFEASTEEVSSESLDAITIQNMTKSIRNNSMDAQRVIAYDTFIKCQKDDVKSTWNNGLVNLVTSHVLKRLCLKGNGDKIIPSSYRDIYDTENNTPDTDFSDGKSIVYPPIPCVNSKMGNIRVIHHEGTKRYLAKLSPSKRTDLFVNPDRGNQLLCDVLSKYYENKWEVLIGELQFSFVVFLTMGCLSSFEHWRDTISMISFSSEASVTSYTSLFITLIQTIICQMNSFDLDFFQETQYTDGNFFEPAIRRIHQNCVSSSNATLNYELRRLSESFEQLFLRELTPKNTNDNTNLKPERDELDETIKQESTSFFNSSTDLKYDSSDSDSDSDDDLPLIVPAVEVDASFARFNKKRDSFSGNYSVMDQDGISKYKHKYPLLFSAIMSHEDIVMTCARILDEKNDVSLVREASAYLEEVEQRN